MSFYFGNWQACFKDFFLQKHLTTKTNSKTMESILNFFLHIQYCSLQFLMLSRLKDCIFGKTLALLQLSQLGIQRQVYGIRLKLSANR